jgi:hypothetical protein
MSKYFYHFVTKAAFLAAAILTFFVAQASTANAASVSLAWDASTGPNVAGYKIRYGTTSQTYTQQLDVGNATIGTVSNLTAGTSYYLATTAYDTSGVESGFSNEVSYIPTTPTPTPSPTPTATPRTPSPTPTPVQTPTPAPTPTSITVSGNISNCANPVLDAVPNVILTQTGTSSGSTQSDSAGNYQFSPLQSGGTYTVTPSKAPLAAGSAGITTFDVLAIHKHYLGIAPLAAGCPATAADVNGDAVINTMDVLAVQRFYLGATAGTANVGRHNFSPASRTYTSLTASQPGQNYAVTVVGDVVSPFADRPEGTVINPAAVSRVQDVALPDVAIDQTVTNFVVSATATMVDPTDGLVGFQGDFTFDERVVSFENNPIEGAGLTAVNWNVSASILPGDGPIRTLRVSAYSIDFVPLSGSGELFNLRMIRGDGASGATTTGLDWQEGSNPFVFIDSNLDPRAPGSAISGSVSLDGDPYPSPNGNP